MADQTEPWAERTVEVSPEQTVAMPSQPGVAVPPQRDAFQRGVASVAPRHNPDEQFATQPHGATEDAWSGQQRHRLPMSYHIARLRVGSEWSTAGGLFAFVCWGIWAISARGDLTSPVITFVITLLVAAGLFVLARLVGRVVWERHLGRVRHSARGAHLVAGIFLVGVGIAFLQQTEWVVSVWNWIFD